jgi:hypothetical protein
MEGSDAVNLEQCLGGEKVVHCVIFHYSQYLVLHIQKDIVELAEDVGFKEVIEDDVEELLQSH